MYFFLNISLGLGLGLDYVYKDFVSTFNKDLVKTSDFFIIIIIIIADI